MIALGLIGCGTVALIVAIIEYRQVIRYLWSPEFGEIAGVTESQRTTPALGCRGAACPGRNPRAWHGGTADGWKVTAASSTPFPPYGSVLVPRFPR